MEKALKLINIIFTAASHICGVLVAFFGAKGLAFAIASVSAPENTRQLPLIFTYMTIFASLKVFFGLLRLICENYIDTSTGKYSTIVFCVAMSLFIVYLNPVVGIITAIGFVTIAGMIPVANAMSVSNAEISFLTVYSKSNAFMRDLANGIEEIIQYKRRDEALKVIENYSDDLSDENDELLDYARNKKMLLAVSLSCFCLIILGVMLLYFSKQKLTFSRMLMILAASIFSLREAGKIRD